MKFILVLAMILLCGASPVQVHAADFQGDLYVTDPWGARVETGAQAIVGAGEILVPPETIRWYTNEELRIDVPNRQAVVTVRSPRFRLETGLLDNMLAQGFTITLPLRVIDGKPYINMHRVDTVLGMSIVPHPSGRTVELITEIGDAQTRPQLNMPRLRQQIKGKANLVWDHVLGEPRNLAAEKTIAGLDVISPTWFAVVNEEGLIRNTADMRYVTAAHDKKLKVWALLSNSFDRELTRKILASDKAQDNIIRQMAVHAALYNLDGINVDFENIYDDDRDRLTAFIKKLGRVMKEQNTVLSVDVTVPSNASFWSLCYDRRALGEIADYMMVMTYDEHWRLSPVSGSVASIGWVEKGVRAVLAEVPKEKLLLGVPFYTREWEEATDGNGKVTVTSRALSMAQAARRITDNQADVVWLEDKGQHYTEYARNGNRYRIWLEDSRSIQLKADLVHKYGLAGTAAWRKDFETEDIWSVLKDSLKKE